MFGLNPGWIVLGLVLLLAIAGVLRWDLLRAMWREALNKPLNPPTGLPPDHKPGGADLPHGAPRDLNHAEQQQRPAHAKPEFHRSGKRH
ncbi:hypothetical protein WG899_19820 [Paucibacter sp. AS339]|uniref:hypothetical protein n=1 Tax=Paucibacter hankyongi TaxID=3133434 RepID=UPI00309C61E4